ACAARPADRDRRGGPRRLEAVVHLRTHLAAAVEHHADAALVGVRIGGRQVGAGVGGVGQACDRTVVVEQVAHEGGELPLPGGEGAAQVDAGDIRDLRQVGLVGV